jgi:hypothetical protein
LPLVRPLDDRLKIHCENDPHREICIRGLHTGP